MAKEESAPKYGVADLAKKLGVNEATARVKLRNADVPKNGKSYGWGTDKALVEVVNLLKSDDKPAAKKAPAKKATAKATPKKATKKAA